MVKCQIAACYTLKFMVYFSHRRRDGPRSHRRCKVFMAHLHHGAAGLKPSCRKSTQRATGTALLLRGEDRPLLQIQVLRRLQAKLIPGLDRTKTMPAFVPAAPQLTPVSFIRVRQPGMTTNP